MFLRIAIPPVALTAGSILTGNSYVYYRHVYHQNNTLSILSSNNCTNKLQVCGSSTAIQAAHWGGFQKHHSTHVQIKRSVQSLTTYCFVLFAPAAVSVFCLLISAKRTVTPWSIAESSEVRTKDRDKEADMLAQRQHRCSAFVFTTFYSMNEQEIH